MLYDDDWEFLTPGMRRARAGFSDFIIKRKLKYPPLKTHTLKMTYEKASDIRKLLLMGVKQQSLADFYGTTRSSIAAIAVGRSWQKKLP